MFAYCWNNPVNNADQSGHLYSSTKLHNFILEDICSKDSNKTYKDTHMLYTARYWTGKKYTTYGFCDLYDTRTNEIWDAKRFGGGLTCTKAYAKAQVKNYVVNGVFAKQEPAELKVGGTISSIESNFFTKPDHDGKGQYLMWYWDAGDGVIFYDYLYVPSVDEALFVGACVVAGIRLAMGDLSSLSSLGSGALGMPLPIPVPIG